MKDFWGYLSKKFFGEERVVSVKNDITGMEFEFVSAENHDWSATITSSPIETGATVSDHIHKQPDKLVLSGVISNSPIKVWRGSVKQTIDGLLDSEVPVQKAFDQLYKLIELKELLTVYTRYREYPNMVLTGLSIPRSAALGNSIEFTATFQQINVVSTLLVEAEKAGINPNATDSAATAQKTAPTRNKGQVQPSPQS